MRFRFLALGALSFTVFSAACAPTLDSESSGETESAVSSSNDKIAFDYFLGKGLKNFQAAGIVGNLDQESQMNPTIRQPGGPGRGIAQWSEGGRWDSDANDNAVAFARKKGADVNSLSLQLDFIWYELTTFSGYGLSALQASTNVTDATVIFQNRFEGCGNCLQSTRIQYAKQALSDFGNDTGTSSGDDDDSGPGPDEGSPLFATSTQQHVFFHTAQNELHHAFWDASDQKIHHDTWGTGLAGTPATLVFGGQQHVFGRSTSGALEHWLWDPKTNVISSSSWGTGLAGDPTVAAIGSQLHAWAIDGSGMLQHWYQDGSAAPRNDQWGAGLAGRPSAFISGSEQHVFARGTGGSVEHHWWEPTNGFHNDTYGDGLASDPAARLVNGQLHVWGVDAAGALQHWWRTPGQPIGHDTWIPSGVVGRPTVLIDGDAQHVFVRGTDGSVQHVFWSSSTGMKQESWGTGIATDPSAIVMFGAEHVFANGADGTVQHWYKVAGANVVHDAWGN